MHILPHGQRPEGEGFAFLDPLKHLLRFLADQHIVPFPELPGDLPLVVVHVFAVFGTSRKHQHRLSQLLAGEDGSHTAVGQQQIAVLYFFLKFPAAQESGPLVVLRLVGGVADLSEDLFRDGTGFHEPVHFHQHPVQREFLGAANHQNHKVFTSPKSLEA